MGSDLELCLDLFGLACCRLYLRDCVSTTGHGLLARLARLLSPNQWLIYRYVTRGDVSNLKSGAVVAGIQIDDSADTYPDADSRTPHIVYFPVSFAPQVRRGISPLTLSAECCAEVTSQQMQCTHLSCPSFTKGQSTEASLGVHPRATYCMCCGDG